MQVQVKKQGVISRNDRYTKNVIHWCPEYLNPGSALKLVYNLLILCNFIKQNAIGKLYPSSK